MGRKILDSLVNEFTCLNYIKSFFLIMLSCYTGYTVRTPEHMLQVCVSDLTIAINHSSNCSITASVKHCTAMYHRVYADLFGCPG